MKVGVLGSDEFITGFRLVGVAHVFPAKEGLNKAFEKAVADTEVGVLVVHEDDLEKLPAKRVKELEQLDRPILVTITEKDEKSELNELIKRCIGIEVGG